MTTDQPTTPKKAGRPRKATPPTPEAASQPATTPQDSPSPESKPPQGTQVPAEPEIATQGLEGLPTISVEELVEGMDRDLVMRVDVALARHMVWDHRMTWGEVRTSLGYGLKGQNPEVDVMWDKLYARVLK